MENNYKISLQGILDKQTTNTNIQNSIQEISRSISKNKGLEITAHLSDRTLSDIQNQLNSISKNLTVNINASSLNIGNLSSIIQQLSSAGGSLGQQFSSNFSNSFNLSGNKAKIDDFKKSLSNLSMSSKGIERIAQNFSNLNVQIKSISASTSDQAVKVKGEIDHYDKIVTATLQGVDKFGKAITITENYNVTQGEFIKQTTKAASALENQGKAVDSFSKRQQTAVSNLTNTIKQINASATDQNKARSITDEGHLNTLASKYGEITSAIAKMGQADETTFTQEKNNVQALITEYKILRDQFVNMENVRTSGLNGDKLETSLEKARSRFEVLNSSIQKSSLSSKKLEEHIRIVSELLQKQNSELNASDSSKIWTSLRIASEEFSSLNRQNASNNAIEKTKASAQTLRETIESIVSKNSGLASFSKEINGANISVNDIISSLKTLESTGGSGLEVLRAKWNNISTAAKEAGIIQQNASNNAFLTNKLPQISDNFLSGTYLEQISQAEERYARLGLNIDSINGKLSTLKNSYTTFSTAMENYNSVMKSSTSSDEQKIQVLNSLEVAEKNFQTALKSTNQSISLNSSMYMSDNAVKNLISNLEGFMQKNTNITSSAKKQLAGYINQLKQGGNIAKSFGQSVTSSLKQIEVQQRSIGRLGLNWFDTLKKGMTSFSYWTSATFVVMKTIQSVKNAITTVKELDTALVDLRKTAQMSDVELRQFYYKANDVARQMGVTTNEIISQASAWSRLGYSTAEAATSMAKLSSQFASISPDMDVEQATDGLVAVMKAYDISPDQVLDGIMSKVNIIGNNAATTNGEIVNMLMKSSSAMKEANNTLEETIALETAAKHLAEYIEICIANIFNCIDYLKLYATI